VALDHITFEMPNYQTEAAFYVALMGWNLRSDDGKQAVLDMDGLGSAIFESSPERRLAVVTNVCFVIEPWNANTVESELRKRGLKPVAENDAKGFESFHVKGSRWMGPSDHQWKSTRQGAQWQGRREAGSATSLSVYRMEDRLDRPYLFSGY
jgi:hypothetical protein